MRLTTVVGCISDYSLFALFPGDLHVIIVGRIQDDSQHVPRVFLDRVVMGMFRSRRCFQDVSG